jgi:hypothetical protein
MRRSLGSLRWESTGPSGQRCARIALKREIAASRSGGFSLARTLLIVAKSAPRFSDWNSATTRGSF